MPEYFKGVMCVRVDQVRRTKLLPVPMTSSLSPSDIETLQAIGQDTIQSIVALCVETFLWSEFDYYYRRQNFC